MKLILRADRKGVGKRGDIVDVSDGFARNYLLPKGLAIKASDGAVAQAGAMRKPATFAIRKIASAQTIASALVSKTITIAVKAGAEGRLFGSVTAADVAAAVEAQAKIAIDRRKLHVEHIKSLGTYNVSAKLHHDVEFPISIEVVAQ